ncbi:hypothetical protein Glove_228g104 [Diversispora epigaea]|uniref:Inner centromere protein ARK-binding domain-containing protein n=1 Tax=Diversispora epigaea TaxID=1348612 RepID=A0A397ILI6_9GLOM|nr:hypothetical protein Glove_228g104 [Diversispora epigaea]
MSQNTLYLLTVITILQYLIILLTNVSNFCKNTIAISALVICIGILKILLEDNVTNNRNNSLTDTHNTQKDSLDALASSENKCGSQDILGNYLGQKNEISEDVLTSYLEPENNCKSEDILESHLVPENKFSEDALASYLVPENLNKSKDILEDYLGSGSVSIPFAEHEISDGDFDWCNPDRLHDMLVAQQNIDPESIFGKVPPLDLPGIFQDVFGMQYNASPRSSSEIWSEEECDDK